MRSTQIKSRTPPLKNVKDGAPANSKPFKARATRLILEHFFLLPRLGSRALTPFKAIKVKDPSLQKPKTEPPEHAHAAGLETGADSNRYESKPHESCEFPDAHQRLASQASADSAAAITGTLVHRL